MKSDQSIKHSLNRMEKVPRDHPIPVPFDYFVHLQISSLSFLRYIEKIHVICLMQYLNEKMKGFFF